MNRPASTTSSKWWTRVRNIMPELREPVLSHAISVSPGPTGLDTHVIIIVLILIGCAAIGIATNRN